MMIILILISIVLFIILPFTDADIEIAAFPLTGFIIKLGIAIYLLVKLVGISVIDEKIELYSTQNEEIEKKVEEVVKQYMKHEQDTFTELKTDTSYITLVTLYPELKSDELIKSEINLYEKNNQKIIALKEQKINKKIYTWWLYFGK